MAMYKRFCGEIPGIKELLIAYQQWRDIAESEPSDAIGWLVEGRAMTPEIRAVSKSIRKAYKDVNKWGREFVNTVHRLRREGAIEVKNVNPNTDSERYKVAIETTMLLAKYWWVKRVSLFGSVATGTDTEESDVDLLLEPLITSSRVRHAADGISADMKARTSVEVNIMVEDDRMAKSTRLFFERAGFFDASIVLFDRKKWSFSCCGQIMEYPVNKFLHFTYVWEHPLLLFRAGKKRAKAVLLHSPDCSEAIGIVRGVVFLSPGLVWPRWDWPYPKTDRTLGLAIYHGLYDLKHKGYLVEMDPWLVYAEGPSPAKRAK